MSNLAIDGGKSYRKTPFPERTPYGEEEVALVTDAIRSQKSLRSRRPEGIRAGGRVRPSVWRQARGYQNCIPVFADVDDSYNMDRADVERKITDRTAAIMVIHLFGNACDMTAMEEIAKRHYLPLIEDCSQAHTTRYNGGYLGMIGDIAAFSLQQSKLMTTGDGGMTITYRDDWAERMFLFRDKGWSRKPG